MFADVVKNRHIDKGFLADRLGKKGRLDHQLVVPDPTEQTNFIMVIFQFEVGPFTLAIGKRFGVLARELDSISS